MKDFDNLLEQYAELVVKVGVNVQPGQVLMVTSPLETVEFTRLIVKKAYEAGAKYVQVDFEDEQIVRSRYEYADDSTLDYFPAWKAKMLEKFAEEGGATLTIRVPDPELYKGIDSQKVARSTKAAAQARRAFADYTRNSKISWCLIKAPTRAWANKVFADIPEEERISVMWDTIFKMNRVDGGDAVQNWHEHLGRLMELRQKLNGKRYKSLHYRAPGTDLHIELAEGHIWHGGASQTQDGTSVVHNMPTEEVFTMPKRDGVNGYVTSTMPLNLNGRLVDRIRFTFKDGKVTEFTAGSGEEHLASLLATDEGASYLGEVALVPYDSPISNLNRIFYNTGVDENASCHLALGSAYPTNIENGTQMNNEELLRHGCNVSLIHTDFMIGSAELDIDGELQDGSIEPVFRKGNWVID
ncbi:aminopeptidase [Paenibacillus jiagnxiensis]|uniref:aminopeptidase n=1 Tax=Paenibacillus jiagnxiensis TaxID=3228926 RepID=UPI0033A82F56